MLSQTDDRARMLKRLALIVDDSRPSFMREAAIRAVQSSLAPTNPLRLESASDLLDRILPAWGVRLYRENGRAVLRKVTRPPISLADVWS